jgi:hypothetical protein
MSAKNNRLWILPALLLWIACAPAANLPANTQQKTPALSGSLVSGCTAGQYPNDDTGLRIGNKAVDFTLRNVDGNEVRLSAILSEKPVLLELGSFSCFNCRQQEIASNTLYEKYSDKVNFILVHTIEAYPVGSPCPYTGSEFINQQSSYDWNSKPIRQPKTFEERLAQARESIKELQIHVPVLVDSMDNAVWCTYGPASNIAYLIDSDGTIVAKQLNYFPLEMELAILKLLQNK